MNRKRSIVVIVSILAIIAILALGVSIYKNNNEKKAINNIEELISNGEYEEAIKFIDETKSSEILILYKNILRDLLEIKDNNDMKKTTDKVNSFKNKYATNLKNSIFSKVNEDISKIEKDIKTYYEKVSNEKEAITVAINEDIDSAKVLIDSFKKNYPNEDISSIEEKYNKKLEEEKKALEENKVQEDNDIVDEDSNNNNEKYISELGISNTVASKNSSQIITVVSKGGSYGELAFWEKDNNGQWRLVDKVSARLGQNGMKSASEVYEMDKCTPTGIYSLTEAFGIYADPGTALRYRQLEGSEYWVDDINSEYYNTMQFGEPNGRWSSAEKLIDYPGYYNYSLVIDYNRWPVIPGKSSAIFLHCDVGSYTYGCVAIPEQNLVNILQKLDPEKDPFIIMDFTYEDIYTKY
ncbi:hypothetical protein R0131_12700 [Clostridium sp. AL.422]|uniref:L,D-transpeptidase family protein n=1 Tax=Clostridium TaxID=1485 RepID=UPI00293DA7A4|nr:MULTISPECIES: hypothetical protein [unclassified Clostridium]MDV4151684.1 hypothetical protein [Clostridium sp. AL.422]